MVCLIMAKRGEHTWAFVGVLYRSFVRAVATDHLQLLES